MRKTSYLTYILLVFVLFCLLSLPKEAMNRIENVGVSCVSLVWKLIDTSKSFFLNIPTFTSKEEKGILKKYNRLAMENQMLQAQVEGIYQWLQFEERIEEQIKKLKEISEKRVDDHYWKEFFQRRSRDMKKSLEFQLQAVPAKIIFRDPSSWSSSAWINVGWKNNKALQKKVVAKNSPVVVGNSLIGVVEFVGKRRSRIRFITDSGCVPSVRAVRGSTQNGEIIQLIDSLEGYLFLKEDLFSTLQEREKFLFLIDKLKRNLHGETKDYYLAKGEVYGSSSPLWRTFRQKLKGVGFNYDYSDEEGGARDLRTGMLRGENVNKLPAIPLIKEGDLLVTTGMDGVFPAGIHVAIVTKVENLPEGGCAYNIEAQPTASRLDDVEVVFVLPPMELEEEE